MAITEEQLTCQHTFTQGMYEGDYCTKCLLTVEQKEAYEQGRKEAFIEALKYEQEKVEYWKKKAEVKECDCDCHLFVGGSGEICDDCKKRGEKWR